MKPAGLFGAALLAPLILVSAVAVASCPPEGLILATLSALDLELAARTARLEYSPPNQLFEKAAGRPDRVAVTRAGNVGQAVVVTATAIEPLWMAINDEDHHATGDFLPLEYSQVIAGSSRGQQRILFQYFNLAGVSRWWVDEVVMSEGLFNDSNQRLWELTWEDRMSRAAEYPLPAVIEEKGLSPIKKTRGAWLLVPLGTGCTLIEYVVDSDPGGALGWANRLAATSVIRDTLEGMVRIAREHIPQPHPEAEFVRPDGERIDRTRGVQ